MLNIILRSVLIISTTLTLSTFASAQTTYTNISGITFGSDGTTASTIDCYRVHPETVYSILHERWFFGQPACSN